MNAAGRLVGRLSRFDHVTPVLRDALHWLPIQQRIVYKIAVFAFDCVRGTCPSYFDCVRVPAHHTFAASVLHSPKLAVESVFVRRITVTYMCQPQGQNLANVVLTLLHRESGTPCLSIYLRFLTISREQFRARLKTHLFKCPRTIEECNYLLTYLLTYYRTRGQNNLTKSASRVRGHPRGSKVVPLNSWGRDSY